MTQVRRSVFDRVVTLSTRVHEERGGPVRAYVDDPDGLRSRDYRHLLIFVHGFNNSRSVAEDRYEMMLANLEEHFGRSRYAPDAIAFFHWPGNEAVGFTGALDFAGYHIDILRARDSAARLAEYLASLPPPSSDPDSLKITIVGHSLGCRLIMEMLAQLANDQARRIGVVSLMAPAVPIELIANSGRLSPAFGARQVLKFFSRADTVLWIAFPLGQHAAFASGIEPQFYQKALGRFGDEVNLGTNIQTANGHGDYWGDREAANKLSAAIDPTFYALPTPRQLASRKLPGLIDFLGRRLPS